MYSSIKNIKLQPVLPSMPLEALWISRNRTDSASDGINGGTGCSFIFFTLFIGNDLKELISVRECKKFKDSSC